MAKNIECPECKTSNTSKTKYCKNCGHSFVKGETNITVDRTQVYKILCYISFLWIVALCVPERKDKKLQFHVAQGLVLSVLSTIAGIVFGIVNSIIKSALTYDKTKYIWGIAYKETVTSPVAGVIATILYLGLFVGTLYFAINGIRNILDDKEKSLPYIGKYGEQVKKLIFKK